MTVTECDHCGVEFEAKRAAKYCSSRCRQRAHRGHGPEPEVAALPVAAVQSEVGEWPTVQATRAALEAAGRADHYLGAAALGLAGRIDVATAVMGYAALVKQLEATMASALAGTGHQVDVLDELRARRDSKRAG